MKFKIIQILSRWFPRVMKTTEILTFLSANSKDEVSLVLRSPWVGVIPHGILFNLGFRFPKEGPVETSKWSSEPLYGGDLFGFLWGEGNGEYGNKGDLWQIIAVKDFTNLGDRVSFKKGWVLYSGTQEKITHKMSQLSPERVIVGRVASVGDGQSVTVGYRGHAIAGHNGSAIAGDYGTAKVGSFGKAQTGDWGFAQAGNCGHAITGFSGRSMVGYKGKASAGKRGVISIDWYDGPSNRMRTKVGYVGEDDIKPNVWYCVDENGNFVEVEEE